MCSAYLFLNTYKFMFERNLVCNRVCACRTQARLAKWLLLLPMLLSCSLISTCDYLSKRVYMVCCVHRQCFQGGCCCSGEWGSCCVLATSICATASVFFVHAFLSARAVLLRWLLLQRGVGQLLLSCNIYKGNCKRVFVHAFSMCTGSASTVAAAMLTLI